LRVRDLILHKMLDNETTPGFAAARVEFP